MPIPTPTPGSATVLSPPVPNPAQFNAAPGTAVSSAQYNSNNYGQWNQHLTLIQLLNGCTWTPGGAISTVTVSAPVTASVTPCSSNTGTGATLTLGLSATTISGVPLGSILFALTPSTHLTGGAYNGSAGVTLATDATNANTPNTIVARDINGDFLMRVLTATGLVNTPQIDLSGAGSLPASGHVNITTDGTTMYHNLFSASGEYWFRNNGSTLIAKITATGQGVFTGLTAGTGTVQGSSNGSTTSYVPPVYTTAGAATAGTLHGALGYIVGDSSTTSFAVTLTGSAVFANTDYVILLPPSSSSPSVTGKSTSGFTLNFSAPPIALVHIQFLAIGP